VRRVTLSWIALILVVSCSVWVWWGTTGTSDALLWRAWIDRLMARGPRGGYIAIQADYPPGTSIVLWLAGLMAQANGAETLSVLKFILLAFLLATTGLLLAASRRPGLSAFAHAGLALNSFGLMYLDIFTAPFLIGAFWAAAKGRLSLLTGLLAAACVMKWQPLWLWPFVLIYVFRTAGQSQRRKDAWLAVVVAIGVAGLAVLIYGMPALYDALNRAGHHNDLSNFGANPLWILTWWFEHAPAPGRQGLSPGGLVTIMAAGRPLIRALSLLTLICYAIVVSRYWKSRDPAPSALLRFSIAGYLVYFLCSTGVHENHLFLAALLAVLLAWQEQARGWIAVILVAAANLNLLAFYHWDGGPAERLIGHQDLSVWIAVIVSVATVSATWRLAGFGRSSRPAPSTSEAARTS
jgi:hypothetical protein